MGCPSATVVGAFVVYNQTEYVSVRLSVMHLNLHGQSQVLNIQTRYNLNTCYQL